MALVVEATHVGVCCPPELSVLSAGIVGDFGLKTLGGIINFLFFVDVFVFGEGVFFLSCNSRFLFKLQ